MIHQHIIHKPIRLQCITIIALALSSMSVVHAATITWDGSYSETWTNSANWQGDKVPGPNDVVVIPGGTLHSPLLSTATATIKRLLVYPGASLVIAEDASLYIDGSTATGVGISGILTNYGKLYINNTGSHGLVVFIAGTCYLYGDTYVGNTGTIGGYGVRVRGHLILDGIAAGDVTPTLKIDHTAFTGLFCDGGQMQVYQTYNGLIDIHSKIQIGFSELGSIVGFGLWNTGEFLLNAGVIDIRNTGKSAIRNGNDGGDGGTMTVGYNGHFKIGNTSSPIGSNGAQLDSNSTCTNYGLIEINNTSSTGILCIKGTSLMNYGDVKIGEQDTIKHHGLAIWDNTTVINQGSVWITEVDSIGLTINDNSTLTNQGGTMWIYDIGGDGLVVNDNGTLTNQDGLIWMTDTHENGLDINSGAVINNGVMRTGGAGFADTTGLSGIENSGQFTNGVNGSLEINSSILVGILNGGSFVNAGEITIGAIHPTIHDAIQNQRDFLNESTGKLFIMAGDKGIVHLCHDGTCTFANDGLIEIGKNKEITGNAIQIRNYPGQEIFQNNGCTGRINIYDGEIFDYADVFENTGIIAQYNDVTSEVQVNNGLLINYEGQFTVAQGDTSLPLSLDYDMHNLWTGCQSNDWNNALNWSDATVPSENDAFAAVLLPVSPSPTVSANDTARCAGMWIEDGTNLSMSGTAIVAGGIWTKPGGAVTGFQGKAILTGGLINQGDFECSSCTVTMTGSAGQSVIGNPIAIAHLMIDKPSNSVSAITSINIWHTFILNNGTFEVLDGAVVITPSLDLENGTQLINYGELILY